MSEPLDLSDRDYTAAYLAGDSWWIEHGYAAVIVGGRTRYEEAQAAPTTIRLARVEVRPSGGLVQINRYVAPETRLRLVRIGGPS